MNDLKELYYALSSSSENITPILKNYFLYSFGNAVRVHFDKDGVSITKLKEGEYEGVPLGTEMF